MAGSLSSLGLISMRFRPPGSMELLLTGQLTILLIAKVFPEFVLKRLTEEPSANKKE
jgi:hypothetical protein